MNTGTSQALVVRPKDLALAVQSNGLAVEQDMLYAAVAELGKFPALVRKVRGVPLAKLVGTVGTEKWKHEPERTVEDANEHCFGLFRLDYGKNPRVFLNLGATRQLSEWVPGEVTCVREAHEGPEAVACTLVHELGHYLYAVKLLNEYPEGTPEDVPLGPFSRLVKRNGVRTFLGDKFMTRSARWSPDEWIAESFAAYHYHREDLEKLNPEAVEVCEEMLR